MTPSIPIPEAFAERMLQMHGDEGAAWLARLPRTVAESAARWNLEVDDPFPELSYNWVAPARRRDGSPAVLKAGFPEDPELQTEIQALRLYDGRGICRLLEAEPADGAFLLERVLPGTPLAEVEEDEAATAIAASVMRGLWRPAPAGHPFPTLARWFLGFRRMRERFDGGTGPLPAPLVGRAEELFEKLLYTAAEPVLLHGDLHHWNILRLGDGWLAIDPKGLVGEPAYEAGALLRNRIPEGLPEPEKARLLTRRIEILAGELSLDPDRIRGWAVAQAVLSACWSVEDHGCGWEDAIRCAELLGT